MRAQATPPVILAPAGLLNAFRYSRTGRETCDDRARRTHRPAGDAHPQRPSPPPQAVLRDTRDRRAGLRDPGDSGEAREEDPAEEGDGIGRGCRTSPMAPSNTFKRAIRFVFLWDDLPAHRSRVVREYVRAQRAGSRWGSSPGTRPSSIRWSMCGATGTLEGAHGSWPSAVTVVALFVHPDVRGFPGTLCLQIWLAVICPVPVSLMVDRHPHDKELQFLFPLPTVSMSVGWLM